MVAWFPSRPREELSYVEMGLKIAGNVCRDFGSDVGGAIGAAQVKATAKKLLRYRTVKLN
jgi:hypothetical protein